MQSKIQSIALKNLRSILIERGISAESLFSKYDLDGDGSISKSEFSTAISSITGQIAPDAIIDGVFSVLDKDSSGLLDFHELISLVDSEGKSSFDNGENILVSEHSLPKYNGIYKIQNNEINGKPWFKNNAGSILYFYNANSGGDPSWSLDDRSQDGTNDWYRGGWTRPPNSGGPPLGTRRWVGAGTIKMESVSKSDEEGVNQSDSQLDILLSEIDLAMEHFEKRVVEGSLPPEKAVQFANSAFENKVQELPFVLRSPARQAWDKKMNKFNSKIDTLIGGSGVAVAGLGAAAVTGATISERKSESPKSYPEKIRDSEINLSENLETEENDDTAPLKNLEQSSDDKEQEENQEVNDMVQESSKLENSSYDYLNLPEIDIPDKSIKNDNQLLSEAYNDFIKCKMLSERNSLKDKYSSQSTHIKIKIISIERTFGIGLSDTYRGGKTIIASCQDLEDVEIRLPKTYDGESLKPRLELEMQVSVVDWNSIRKRLILNTQ